MQGDFTKLCWRRWVPQVYGYAGKLQVVTCDRKSYEMEQDGYASYMKVKLSIEVALITFQ
jgi:hypothetical protein